MPQKVPRRTRIRRRVFRNSHAEQFRRGQAYGNWCFFSRDLKRHWDKLFAEFVYSESLTLKASSKLLNVAIAYLNTNKIIKQKEKEMSQ